MAALNDGHMRMSIVSIKGVFLSGLRTKVTTSVFSVILDVHLNSPHYVLYRATPYSIPCISVS